jgi:hypothetical protein
VYKDKAGCCTGSLKKMRAAKMKDMLAKKDKESIFVPIYAFIADALHIFDIYTDMRLAQFMYYISRRNIDANVQNDYNKCFVWIILAVIGPYLIQYATLMSLLYNKGAYNS